MWGACKTFVCAEHDCHHGGCGRGDEEPDERCGVSPQCEGFFRVGEEFGSQWVGKRGGRVHGTTQSLTGRLGVGVADTWGMTNWVRYTAVRMLPRIAVPRSAPSS